MRHTEIAIRRPVGTIMIFVALGLVGIISARLLPLEKFPDIQWPGIWMQAPYPGSSPEELEERITRPMEEALATLSGVTRMESTTRGDRVEMELLFEWGSEVSTKGIEARAKLDAIRDQLPDDLENIFLFTGGTADQPILVLRISSDQDLSLAYDLLDRNLKRRVERIEGVSRAELQGVFPQEIRILLDPNRLAAHGIDARELNQRLMRSNFSISGGQITDAGQRFFVRPEGEFRSLDDIRNTPINDRGLLLRNVAEVSLRVPERDHGRHLERRYAIGLEVYKSTTANLVDVAERVMAEVEKVRDLPQMSGVQMVPLENQARDVKDSLRDLLVSGAIGALLAVIVLYLFLRQLATTLVVTLSVPFSLLITLAVMYFLGLSLNILSLMGLMLAVGMLVDNAVVVCESIFRLRQKEQGDPFELTARGVREVGLAVIAGTMTSIIVFVPIAWGGKTDIAIFMTHVAITIAVALISSLVIAQTLVPALAARIKPPRDAGDGRFLRWLTDFYARAISWVLRHRLATFLLIVLVSAGTGIPMQAVKKDMFPQEAGRRLHLPYHIEGIYPLDKMEEVVNRVEDYLYSKREELDIRTVYSYFDERWASSTLYLTEDDAVTRKTRDIIAQIEEELPEIVIGKPSFSWDNVGGGEGFTLQLSGDSGEQLERIGGEVVRLLGQVEGLNDLRKDIGQPAQELRVIVDRERAALMGFSVQDIAGAVSIAMRGQPLREFRGDSGEIEVRLAFREDDQNSLAHLAALPLYTARGDLVELGNIARFDLTQGPREIRRINRQSAMVIEGTLADEGSLDEIRPLVEKVMASYALPAGYDWRFGRGFDRHQETEQMLVQNILLGIMLIFIVMAALFESTLYPLSIITSIAFSVMGVFWFFMLTGTTFSFMAFIGILILIGIVVNNGIVLIDHVNNLRARGMPRDEAIVQAGRDRLRPILMTVATTILGLLPLAIGNTQVGGDGPPYFPMARAIIGGLAFSTLASLLVVPYVYVQVDNAAKWSRRVLQRSRGTGGHRLTAVNPASKTIK